MGCEQPHSGQVWDTAVPCVTAVDVAGDRHKAYPSPMAQQRYQAGTMCPCPVLECCWPSSMCSKQSGTLALTLVSNTLWRRKIPFIAFFQSRFCCKKHHMRDEGSRERRVLYHYFHSWDKGIAVLPFFSLRNILPLPRCTLKKRDKAAARQGRSSRQTARYGKPGLSQGRALARSLRSIMARH